MGIQFVKPSLGKSATEMPGPLQLPPTFDRTKYAAKWVKQGQDVAAAEQREWIPGTSATADGWVVWRDPETKKPKKVPLSKGTYVLLCRDLDVQKAVNAICGNIGKQRLLQERAGETVAGEVPTDPGILGDSKLEKVFGREDEPDGDVKMNPVPGEVSSSRVSPPVASTVASRRTRRS